MKTKPQLTEITTTEESLSFKRQRMKEVRTMVARAVKQNKRIDLMGFTGSDIARSQIALQDLLSKSQERHKKATERLASTNQLGLAIADVIDSAADKIVSDQERISELSMMLRREREEHMRTASITDEKIRENEGLKLALKGVVNG
jgi:hypothetical protein